MTILRTFFYDHTPVIFCVCMDIFYDHIPVIFASVQFKNICICVIIMHVLQINNDILTIPEEESILLGKICFSGMFV